MELDLVFTEEVNKVYEQLKKKEIRFAVFKNNEAQTECQLETVGEREKGFNDFRDAIPKAEPRWAIIDLHIERPDGSTADKLILVHYSPDDYSGSLKFFFATAKGKVESTFVGVNKTWQVGPINLTSR